LIEKSYTEEEIAEIVRRHGLPRYPKLALYREKLLRKAKAEPNFRFYCLYGQLLRMDVLRCAYEQVRANKGAPGVDGMTFGDIERDKDGVDGFLTSIQKELKAKTYRASPVKRVYIEKANGKLRPLGIPTIRDRTIQAAVKLVVGPKGEDEWVPDEENGLHLRLAEKVSKAEIGRILDDLMCRPPQSATRNVATVGRFSKAGYCGMCPVL
jgi:RNA-directed DNA polymerase